MSDRPPLWLRVLSAALLVAYPAQAVMMSAFAVGAFWTERYGAGTIAVLCAAMWCWSTAVTWRYQLTLARGRWP